jgi:hypothetical protein
MSVTSATGFPSPTGVQYFYCTLADAATQTNIEIVKVTSVTGTTFAITRAQDGTSATAFAAGAVVSLRLVRASLNDFPKLDEANTFTGLLTANSFASSSATITGGTLNGVAIGQTVAGDGTFDVLTANVTNLTNVTSSAGIVITGTFSGSSPTDGLVMDYATGWGRFSDFGGDGFQWYNAGLANTKLMQLSSTGVITTATWNGATVGVAYGGTGITSLTAGYIPYGNGTGAFNSSANLYFDGNNLGLGVTPSSWSSTYYKTLQLAGNGNYVAGTTPSYSGAPYFFIGNNGYDDTGSGFKYTISSAAAQYVQVGAAHRWNIASAGTAGNAISFTQAMTLFSSGGLSIGNTTDPGATNLSVNGSLGVGTAAPSEKLEIKGSVASPITIKLRNDSASTSAGTKVLFGNYAGTDTAYLSNQFDGATFNTKVWQQGAGYMAFGTSDVERMRIHSSGGVSIGNTTDPSATNLSVQGNLTLNGSVTGNLAVTGSTYSVTTTNNVTLGTPVTVYSFPNLGSGGDSSYMVTAGSNRGDATNFSAYAIIMTDAGTSRIMASALSVGVSISMSGLDLIITNGAGGTIAVKTNILKLM